MPALVLEQGWVILKILSITWVSDKGQTTVLLANQVSFSKVTKVMETLLVGGGSSTYQGGSHYLTCTLCMYCSAYSSPSICWLHSQLCHQLSAGSSICSKGSHTSQQRSNRGQTLGLWSHIAFAVRFWCRTRRQNQHNWRYGSSSTCFCTLYLCMSEMSLALGCGPVPAASACPDSEDIAMKTQQ